MKMASKTIPPLCARVSIRLASILSKVCRFLSLYVFISLRSRLHKISKHWLSILVSSICFIPIFFIRIEQNDSQFSSSQLGENPNLQRINLVQLFRSFFFHFVRWIQSELEVRKKNDKKIQPICFLSFFIAILFLFLALFEIRFDYIALSSYSFHRSKKKKFAKKSSNHTPPHTPIEISIQQNS